MDGSWVDEQSATNPSNGTGGHLREAEKLLLAAPQLATILRVAGIYGPDRGFLFRQFVKGEMVYEKI